MKSVCRIFSVLAACSAAACGSTNDDEPTLTHYSVEIAQATDALQTTALAHSRGILEENDLERMYEIERQYTRDMAMGIGHMWDAHDSMQTCGEFIGMDGHHEPGPQFHDARMAVSNDIGNLSTELGRHQTAMQGATSASAAWTEEERHQTAMDQLMDHMWMSDDLLETAIQGMTAEGFSTGCPMDGHMHRMW